jgi:hypothetical protein
MYDFYVYQNGTSITMFDINGDKRIPILFSTVAPGVQKNYWDIAVHILEAEAKGVLHLYNRGKITSEHCELLRKNIYGYFFKDEDEN